MEIWDIYNKNRIKTRKTVERGSRLALGDYHLVVHICIFNSNGKMLIQQRQPFKYGWSNMWDITVGGSALSGETSTIAAEREAMEEIGLSIDLSDARPHFTVNFSAGFDDYYLIKTDLDVSKLELQYEEVQGVKWATQSEIIDLLEEGVFVPYRRSLVALMFEIAITLQTKETCRWKIPSIT